MPHQIKKPNPYFFVDNKELHHWKSLRKLIGNLQALFEGDETLTREHEQTLFRGMHACGYALTKLVRGRAAGRRKATLVGLYNRSKEVLVKLNLGLIGDMRRKTRAAHGQENTELESDGNFALFNAVSQFDPWRGNKFSTYGCTAIQRGFLHLARKSTARFGLAGKLADVLRTRNLGRGKVSAEHEHLLERLKLVIRENYASLTDMELYVLSQRVLHDPMHKEEKLHVVGESFDLSKERIRQIQVSATQKLRIYFGVIDDGEGEIGEEEEYCLAACA